MSQDFKKIATEALKQCKIYEACIESMRRDLQLNKKANIALDMQLLQKSVDSLVKIGSLKQDQRNASFQILKNDPNAALRAITALCEERSADASSFKKSASVQQDVTGGTLIGRETKMSLKTVDDRQEGYAAVAKAFNLNS